MMDSSEWLNMINTHVQWKQRLHAYIMGTSTEIFNVATVASDNKCILGTWIYNNAQKFKQTEIFENVRLGHAEIHFKASEIILLTDQKKVNEAEQLLEGEFAEISNQFKRDLIRLSRTVN